MSWDLCLVSRLPRLEAGVFVVLLFWKILFFDNSDLIADSYSRLLSVKRETTATRIISEDNRALGR